MNIGVRAAMICVGWFATLAVAGAEPAQSSEQQWIVCENQRGEYTDDLSVAACTTAIESERLTAQQLVLALNNRGLGYHNQRDYARAIADFDRAIQLDPQFAAGLSNRANARLKAEDYAGALADLNEAVRLDPTMAAAFELRGDYFYYGARDFERALSDYDEAVRLAPDVAHFRNAACWVRAANLNRDLERARGDCDAAVRLSDGDPNNLNSRGLVHLKQRRYGDAWSDYNAAVTADATDAHSLFGRGVAALGLGRTDEGRADLRAAQALDSSVAGEYASYGVEF
jgi:tetratricopeptide (TPR) repeat protein